MINGERMNTNLVKGILIVLLFTFITSCEFGAKSFAPESIGGMTFSFTVTEDPAEGEASQVGNIAICTFFKDGTYKLFWQKGNRFAQGEEGTKGGFKYGKGHYTYEKEKDSQGLITWKTAKDQFTTQLIFTSPETADYKNFDDEPDRKLVDSGIVRFK